MATDALCLENIDEFVNDENKIVTCKWLSLTLKIHINQAKRLLYTFLQQQRQKDKDVNATYFVAGLSKGDNGHMEHKCLVVAEEDLDVTRGRLSTVTSCHVYSIQRANLKDSNSLYATDYEGVQENLADCNKYSSIHCQRAAEARRQPSRKTASPDKAPSSQRVDKGGKGDGQKPTNGSMANKPSSVEAAAAGRGKKGEPKGSIATMFAQSNKNKDSDAAKGKEPTTKEAAKENKPAAKKGGVMDFFNNAKPAAKPKAAAAAEEKEAPITKERKSEEKKGKQVPETKSKKSRARADSDSDDQPDKKRRRRIKNDLFDSSSEEEMEIEEESPPASPVKEPSPEPASPVRNKKTPEKRPSPAQQEEKSTTNGGKQRRRRRKLVPKTYLDEDGFMVTEKVWESESTDASEVEEDARKASAVQKKPEPAPAKKASPQKKASPAKGKQTSLTSFFKKK